MPRSELLRQRDFLLLWGGQVVSTLGSAASTVIYPLLILQMTQSAMQAGVGKALFLLPYVILSLPAGVFADRADRRQIMLWCDVGRLLAVGSIAAALVFDRLSLIHLFCVIAVEGSLFVLFNVAEVAALPRVVAKDQLATATGLNEASFAVASVAGPALGTALYAMASAIPFAADALSYLASAMSLACLRTDFSPMKNEKPAGLWSSMREGLSWLWSQRLMRLMALVTGGLNFTGAAVPLLLIVAAKESGAPATAIGLMFSIGGLGAVLGSLVAPTIRRNVSFGTAIAASVIAQTLVIPLFALQIAWPVLGALYAVFCFVGPVYNVVQFTYRVSVIPDQLQGRVNSAYRLVAFGFNPAGALVCGVLIESRGISAAVLATALCSAAVAVICVASPHIRGGRGRSSQNESLQKNG